MSHNVTNVLSADFMTIHIRAIGNWTKRLYEFFKDKEESIEPVDPSTEAFQATNELHKTTILESLAEEGSINHSDAMKEDASSAITKSTYLELDSDLSLPVQAGRKVSAGGCSAVSDFSVPGTVNETIEVPGDTEVPEDTEVDSNAKANLAGNNNFDSVDESGTKQLLNSPSSRAKFSEDVTIKDGDDTADGKVHKLPRVLRGARKLRLKPLMSSHNSNSVPLLTSSNEYSIVKPRSNSDGSHKNSTASKTHNSSTTLTEATVLQHNRKASKFSRQQSSISIVSVQSQGVRRRGSVMPQNKKVLGRMGTQHSLNISKIEEYGAEDTGVEVSSY